MLFPILDGILTRRLAVNIVAVWISAAKFWDPLTWAPSALLIVGRSREPKLDTAVKTERKPLASAILLVQADFIYKFYSAVSRTNEVRFFWWLCCQVCPVLWLTSVFYLIFPLVILFPNVKANKKFGLMQWFGMLIVTLGSIENFLLIILCPCLCCMSYTEQAFAAQFVARSL